MIRVLFLLRSLNQGGTERQLTHLARGMDKERFDVTVATFYDGGGLRGEIDGLPGVRVASLGKGGRWDVAFLRRLYHLADEVRPHVVHGYLPGGNALALPTGRRVGAAVVWGVRSADVDYSRYNWAEWAAFRAGATLSRRADRIILNSQAARRYYAARGYAADRMLVIPNGFDTDAFRPDWKQATSLRRDWVGDGQMLIGIVGRLDPMKDHPTFLAAAAALRADWPEARFVCVGDARDEPYATALRQEASRLGLDDALCWAGPCVDMPAAYNALDVLVLSSMSESFPNVVGEAMACGVPCVVTDVGDAAELVGETGVIAPPRDPERLREAIEALLARPAGERAALGQAARERILAGYSQSLLVQRTEAALAELAA